MKTVIFLLFLLALIYCDSSTSKDQTAFYNDKVKIDFGVETGYVSVSYDGNVGNTFYHLLYQSGTNSKTQKGTEPVIIWLNGGPGCASHFGMFEELGPFIVKNNTDNTSQVLSLRETSWNKQGHLLVVDQPYEVGFSYSNATYLVNSTDESAQRFVAFLVQFYADHVNLWKNPLYIFGESYAGHYIPAIGAALLNSPKFQALGVNFAGVGIGDGWTSPIHQIAYYSSYMYTAGLVDNLRRDESFKIQSQAQTAILAGDYLTGQQIFDDLADNLFAKYTGNADVYNIQQYDEVTNTIDPYRVFLVQNKVQFNVPDNVRYRSCNGEMYDAFGGDIAESREADVVQLLNAGKRVLLFNGQLDFIVNTPGSLAWINQMKWGNINQWKMADKNFFSVKQEVVGWFRTYSYLTFAHIYKAGHMVPTDQPEAAYDMLKHWLNEDTIWE